LYFISILRSSARNHINSKAHHIVSRQQQPLTSTASNSNSNSMMARYTKLCSFGFVLAACLFTLTTAKISNKYIPRPESNEKEAVVSLHAHTSFGQI
jgi:hypothetical protein